MKKLFAVLFFLFGSSAFAQGPDYVRSTVHHTKFTTRRVDTSVPATLAGSPVIKVYRDGDTTTEVTTGLTLSVDFDSITGYNDIAIDTTNAFYTNGSEFAIVITTGTVNSVSVVGETVFQFTVGAYLALSAQGGDNFSTFFTNGGSSTTAVVGDVLRAVAIKKNTARNLDIAFVSNINHFTRVTTGTPACILTKDVAMVLGSPATTNQPSAVNNLGHTNLLLAAADTNGTDYIVLRCTLANADPYEQEFFLQ